MISGTALSQEHANRNNCNSRLWRGDSDKCETSNLKRELAGLEFLANFAKEVNGSLKPEEVLTTAARLLYGYFNFSLAIFSLAEGLGGLKVYSPLEPAGSRKEWLKSGRAHPERKSHEITDHRLLGLSTPVAENDGEDHEIDIELAGRCGTIALFCKEESAGLASRQLLAGIGESLATAVRNAREHDKVKELSLRDSLTGLYNRRVLEEILHLEESKRKPSPLSILVLDVDDFKLINDTYGHPAGDQVLSSIGKLLMDNSRKENIVARLGGEEFAILLTNTGLDTALQVAERLRKKLGEQEFEFSGQKVRLSVSIGVAGNGVHSTSPESLMFRADQALYQAKRSGKNRVCSHEAAPVIPIIPEKRRRPPVRFGANRFDGATIA